MLSHLLLCISLLLSLTNGLAIEKRSSRTTSPSGCLVVKPSGASSSEYSTFSGAVTALGSSTSAKCIFLNAGTYKEQVKINYSGSLTIYGSTSDTTSYTSNIVTISSSQTSTQAGTLDLSSAIQFTSPSIKIYNLNLSNTYGPGTQAVAATSSSTHISFYGCSFIGNQDTLYAKSGNQYFTKCYIEGTTDFIFGDAAAWFDGCTIAAKKAGAAITANSREKSTDIGWYVFDGCTVGAAKGVSLSASVFLGRPWRVLSRVIYQNSVLGAAIAAAGWTTMASGATPVYEEFNNSGAGSSTSSRKYLTKATAAVTMKQLWNEDYTSWVDTSY